jgi:hypothetical protein
MTWVPRHGRDRCVIGVAMVSSEVALAIRLNRLSGGTIYDGCGWPGEAMTHGQPRNFQRCYVA